MNVHKVDLVRSIFVCLIAGVLLLVGSVAFAGGTKEAAPGTQQRPEMTSSPFFGDSGALGEFNIQKVLSSKFVLPQKVKIALLKLPENQQQLVQYYGSSYLRSEAYIRNQQSFIDAVSKQLLKSERVYNVSVLPSVLMPRNLSLAAIRETAVRLQADMLLIFSLASNVYEKTQFLKPNQVKGFCTCEAFLLDIRTGLIPFTKIITKDSLVIKEIDDANDRETAARAQSEASLLALSSIGEEMNAFISSVENASIE
jgi:hypothetical protein